MREIKYVCEGTCGAVVTETQFNEGNHVCRTDGCTHLGQPLKRKIQCDLCHAFFNEGDEHQCA